MMHTTHHHLPRTASLLLTGIWLIATLVSSVAHWHRPFSLWGGAGFALVQNGHVTISAGGLVLPKQPTNSSGSILENALMKLFPVSSRTTVESLGFQLAVSRGPGNYRSAYLSIPLWMPYLILVAIPASRWAKSYHRRIFWTKSSECRKCNYNLTGNETGICSECGTTISMSLSGLSRSIGVALFPVRAAPLATLLLVALISWRIYSAESRPFSQVPSKAGPLPRPWKATYCG